MSTLKEDALRDAVVGAEGAVAKRLTCPKCKKRLALLSLSFRSLRVAWLCRFCPYVDYVKRAPAAES